MAAVARGIDETSNAVQLNGFFGKTFYFFNLFSQSATLPVYLFVSLFVNLHFFYLTIFQPWIFSVQGFSLNFARTLGRAVDKLLNGSRVTSHGQFIFGKQSLSLFRGNTAFQQNRRCNFSHFLDMVKTGMLLTFFRKSELLTMKIANQMCHLDWMKYTRYKQSTSIQAAWIF